MIGTGCSANLVRIATCI